MNFADYAILFLYWILLLFLTWKYRKTSDESAHFFLAGRSLGALSVGLSIMVTSFSAVNYLALPGEVFVFGLYVSASLPAFFIAAIPITKYWIPFFHKIQAVSVYAFLENRYDLKVRILCSALFLLWRLFWMAAALYASCRIMSILTGMNFLLILLICGLGAAVYCTFGGMRAVI